MRSIVPMLLLSSCWLTQAELLEKADPNVGGDADTDADTDADSDTDTDADTDVTTGDMACIDADLGFAVGNNVVGGVSTDHSDDFDPDCNGGGQTGGLDAVFGWTAPSAGCFTIDTSESDYDTSLYLLNGCSGAELICNDDVNAGVNNTSSVGFLVGANQSVVIVVDGTNALASGTFQVDINPTDFIEVDFDLASQLGTQYGNTSAVDTTIDPAICPYPSGKDVIVSWLAPSSDVWTFTLTTQGTDFDSVLSLHRQCTSDAFVCDDALFAGGGEYVDALLFEGEPILIRVAGYDAGAGAVSGAFELVISN